MDVMESKVDVTLRRENGRRKGVGGVGVISVYKFTLSFFLSFFCFTPLQQTPTIRGENTGNQLIVKKLLLLYYYYYFFFC
jgi:hypothetical protein